MVYKFFKFFIVRLAEKYVAYMEFYVVCGKMKNQQNNHVNFAKYATQNRVPITNAAARLP